MLKRERGFTLIELLVVIAIIGILSSIVLASLNSARSKGNDAKSQSQLVELRSAAEIYYAANGNYGATVSGSAACGASGLFNDTASGMKALSTPANYPNSPTLICNAVAQAYAVSVPLSANFWCVDSTGASKSEGSALGSGVTACP